MENNNKLYNILAYLGILWLVGLIAAPNEPDVKFHVNQGLVLFLLEIAVGIVSIIPIIGWIVGFAGSIFCLVLTIMGIINAAKGEQKELPLIGKIKILK
jgi:uncharacterized membrane protein